MDQQSTFTIISVAVTEISFGSMYISNELKVLSPCGNSTEYSLSSEPSTITVAVSKRRRPEKLYSNVGKAQVHLQL